MSKRNDDLIARLQGLPEVRAWDGRSWDGLLVAYQVPADTVRAVIAALRDTQEAAE